MPTFKELEDYYRDTYRLEYQFAFFGPPKSHVKKKTNEALRRASVIEKYRKTSFENFLDFGCGSGELVKHLASKGINSFGFEPGASYSQSTPSDKIDGSYKIENASWQSVSYPEKYFDVITMLHVLEHLRNPIDALKKVHSWLKDDGMFYLEVPDLAGYDFKCFEHFHFAHVLGFSRANLILCANKAGFEVLDELSGTSMMLQKARTNSIIEPATLKETFEENYRNYSQNVSVFKYLSYHLKRNFRRLFR